jgi:hypothetical protein
LAQEKLTAHVGFEPAHQLADRGSGHAKLHRRQHETATARGGFKGAQGVQGGLVRLHAEVFLMLPYSFSC